MGCCKLKTSKSASSSKSPKATEVLETDPHQRVHHKSPLSNLVSTTSGSLLQDYEVVRVIGEGGYGQVREVIEKSTGCRRAAKSVQIKFLKKTEIDNIFEEVKILKSLDHPGIIKIFQVYREANSVHIITELCTGGELFDKITKHKRLSENIVAKYMFDIVSTVKYINEAGVIHRDLKPDNILFEDQSNSARLKIIDFGTAMEYEKGHFYNMIIGTPYYMAPEVITGGYNQSCDVWSIGVIMYIMLSGTPPFTGSSNQEIYEKIVEETPKFDSPVWSSVSNCAKVLIKKSLTKDPKKRISINDFFYDPWLRTRNDNLVPEKHLSFKSMENLSKFRQISKLQACTFVFICQSFMTACEMKHVRKLFESFDKNGDGKLSLEEIREGIKDYSGSFQLDPEEIMKECDLDKNGFVDYSEFLAAVSMKSLQVNKQKLKAAFDAIDSDGNGKITRSELRQALVGMSNEKNVNDIIAQIDRNGDGEIDLEEFTDAVLGGGVSNRV
jgi:calcium-dependent protein kinase